MGYELAKLGWRKCKYGATQVGDPRLNRGAGEARVHLPIELTNDRGVTRPALGPMSDRRRLK